MSPAPLPATVTAPDGGMTTAPGSHAGIVRVAVPKPLPQCFDYALPPDTTPPEPGARVRVPFGRQVLTGICVAVNPDDAHPDPRNVDSVLEATNPFGTELFQLAHWLADYYHHPLGEVFATLMPAEMRRGADLTRIDVSTRDSGWRVNAQPPGKLRAPRQQALLDFLVASGGSASRTDIEAAGFTTAIIRGLAARGCICRYEPPAARASVVVGDRLTLNPEQQAVVSALATPAPGFIPALLHGVTGSGKTEVYLQLIEEILSRGQQVLVLVPEIALTPQTIDRFRARFGIAAAMHSGMTDSQRLQAWLGCREGEIDILIGTRSAILTPFRNLGLIVVDEEHDASFKQQDGLRYSARDLAVKRAQGLGIPLVLGSATPSFETLVNATQGRYQHFRLVQRAGGASMPTFHVLDIRGHKLTDGISIPLANAARHHLGVGGQVLLFLNRRGFSPSYVCTGCGWVASCRRCDMRMTLHRNPPALICHHCDQRTAIPPACPACGRSTLQGIGLGTQRAEAGVAELFPDIPVHRIDRDTARSQRRLAAQFAAIRTGEPAVLIGTQMLAKGHHFPNVTLVGIINADAGFLSADFRAPERTAQLITQVAGRAGRAERPGEVWIQTYQPENPGLQALITEGYDGFAARELEHRRSAGLPPFRPMALLRAESVDALAARQHLEACRDHLAAAAQALGAAGRSAAVEILGPVAAPIERIANRHRFQLMLIGASRPGLHAVLRSLADHPPPGRGVRASLDVDPYDAY